MTDEPEVNPKLLRAKAGWAREGRLLTGTTADPDLVRLPPGQRLVKDWPVLDLASSRRSRRRNSASTSMVRCDGR